MRDYQRNKVYSWERDMVTAYDKSLVKFVHAQDIVDYVWYSEGKAYPPKVVELSKQNKNAGAKGSRLEIQIPNCGVSTCTILHEVAHALTSTYEGFSNHHGARFVGVFIKLLHKYGGMSFDELITSATFYGLNFNFKGPVI